MLRTALTLSRKASDMQRLHILAVGKLAEPWLAQGCAQYQKRIAPFRKLSITEIPEHRLPKNPSPAQIEKALEIEALEIRKKLPGKCISIALCLEGTALSSDKLADLLDSAAMRSPDIAFIIGSSHGLCASLKKQADYRLSFSPMTFPHQLARVMLLEQLYRCCSILSGGKYHK